MKNARLLYVIKKILDADLCKLGIETYYNSDSTITSRIAVSISTLEGHVELFNLPEYHKIISMGTNTQIIFIVETNIKNETKTT